MWNGSWLCEILMQLDFTTSRRSSLHAAAVAGRWLGFPAAAACMLPAEF
jgi:hypothetical protein